MARTLIDGPIGIMPGTLTRSLQNTSTAGSAVITKVIAGSNITISSAGADSGTGDVTINAAGATVNTAAQYTWSNTHSFSANVTFSGINTFNNNVGISGTITANSEPSFNVGQTSNTTASIMARSTINTTGGGTIAVNGAGAISWSNRLICMNGGSNTQFSTNGYFDINMPTNGTVITGYGNATNVTVASGTIQLGAWETLYYILPVGSFNASVNGNFAIMGYSTSSMVVPSNWIPICQWNYDNNKFHFLGGKYILGEGDSLDTTEYRSGIAASGSNYFINSGAASAVFCANSNGAYQSRIDFQNNGTTKWQVGKNTDDSFFIYDSVGAKNLISCASAGNPTAAGTWAFSNKITGSISGNADGTAYNITQYTINQNLGTGSTPTFANLYTSSNINPGGGLVFQNNSGSISWPYGPSIYQDTSTGGNGPGDIVLKTYNGTTYYYMVVKTNGDVSMNGNLTVGGGSITSVASLNDTSNVARIRFTNDGSANDYAGGATNTGWQHNFHQADNSVRWVMGGSNTDYTFYCAGGVTTYWSDQRLKELIERVDAYEGLNRVLSYKVVDFQWNEKGRSFNGKEEGARERGLIAQEVQKINPQAVVYNELQKDEDGKPYYTIQKEILVYDLIGAVQEQQKIIDKQQCQINELKYLVSKLLKGAS